MNLLFCLFMFMATISLSGCEGMKMTNPYITEVDRVDQEIAGNKGYLQGASQPSETRTVRKRQLMTVDVDLPPTTKERAEMAAAK